MTKVVPDVAVEDDVDRMLGRLVEPRLADLAAQLRSVPRLADPERGVLHTGVAAATRLAVWRRVSRVVLLELNAARVSGTLTADDSAARWREWVDRLASPGGWEAIGAVYPPLLPRVETIVANGCAAGLRLARRFSRDRPALAQLTGAATGELVEVTIGAGDSHEGGETVSILGTAAGTVVYKPRSVAVDHALAGFLARLLADEPADCRIRVPAVLVRRDGDGHYGFAEYVPHRHCRTEAELKSFYRGLGHWLAVMRLLGGSDLHHENLIACGQTPVVVDCETLFTPVTGWRPSGYGDAADRALRQIAQSLLRTGLLPGRGGVLGLRGMDVSGAGALPGQQPYLEVPTIIDAGTDRARLGLTPTLPEPGRNLPHDNPELGRHWERVVDGFTELSGRLREWDRAGRLAPMLASFAGCQIRIVARDTIAYVELGRMLWHPSSLYRPGPARQRAAELLARHAQNRPGTPDAPAVIDAEIDELLDGDVPVFTAAAGTGVLAGPRGTRYGVPRDLVAEALDRWRGSDPLTDERVLRAALVSAYLNDGWRHDIRRQPHAPLRATALEQRRRASAARLMGEIAGHAIRGDDGSVTWVAPTLSPDGWTVYPLAADLYSGLSGLALLSVGYEREVSCGRADPVSGLPELTAAVIRSLRLADDQQEKELREFAGAGIDPRPDPPGAYLGLGARIWAWLVLHRLGAVDRPEAIRRAEALAARLPAAIAADTKYDLMVGTAGAVTPLLALARHAGASDAPQWRELARRAGDRLREVAQLTGDGAFWPSSGVPEGMGGLSHGVTGIGWALARLARATGEDGYRQLAEAAFAREETYYVSGRGWRDVRQPAESPTFGAQWCHGAVGIGVAAADLLARDGDQRWRDVLRRAAASTLTDGFGWNHTLCHGDFGSWELLEHAWRAGVGPAEAKRDELVAQIITNLEDRGPVGGMARDAFSPSLMAGVGGVAYQLLRLHPDCDLPSVLLPDLPG